jgi:hypothetical protein
MQKAHLYEAIFLVNQGIDQTVRGLERLKRAKVAGLRPAYFDERVIFFEMNRAALNSFFCDQVDELEDRDAGRFEEKHREYEKESLDEVQVYQNVLAVEERRCAQGKPPKVRFLTQDEQREWEGRNAKKIESDDEGAATQ